MRVRVISACFLLRVAHAIIPAGIARDLLAESLDRWRRQCAFALAVDQEQREVA